MYFNHRLRILEWGILGLSLILFTGCNSIPSSTPISNSPSTSQSNNSGVNHPPSIVSDTSPIPTSSSPTSSSPTSSQCVTDYDPSVNYFPDSVTLTHAKGFSVKYYSHYKLVTVSNPWQNADRTFEYLLVQCGTPITPEYTNAQVIQIPIRRSIVLSTTHLPYFDRLKQLNGIVGVRQIDEISNPIVREKIDRGEIQSVGNANSLDLELIVKLQPDLVSTFGIANVETSSIHQLQDLGIPTAVIAEYLEASPLAQAEWLKFIAVFFNQEKESERIFQTIVEDYEKMRKLTQSISDRPSVLTGFNLEGTWYVAGGKSFIAQFIEDAGGNYLWSDNQSNGNLSLDFEAVLDKGAHASVWLNVNQKWQTLNDAVLEDDRYLNFTAFQQQHVFNNDARLNPSGGNDYWESGVINPQIVLADLIKILHPHLLPDHQLVYYRKLSKN